MNRWTENEMNWLTGRQTYGWLASQPTGYRISLLIIQSNLSKVPYSQYNREMTEDYPVTSPYFSELYGSLRSRPGDFMSQYGDGNTEYPANSRETHLNNLLTINEARPSNPRVRKYSAHPPMNPREEYFPEVFWDMNRLRHTHQKPADKRRQDEQQASLGKKAEADFPSTRLDP